jgi:hypothetical protein
VSNDVLVCIIADLCVIAFFFLLRVGEYKIPASKRKTRTVQFRVGDIVFWKNNIIIPNLSPLQTLLTADGATMNIDNQKNGVRGSALYHSAIDDEICPVKALSRRVANATQAQPGNDVPISRTTYTRHGDHATQADITKAVR